MGGCFNPRILAATCLLPVLAGCQLSRPDGAFPVEEMEAGAPLVEFPDAGGGGGGSVVIPGDGDGPGDGDTAPEIPPPEDETFEGLVGTFLMRFDEDTFTSSSSGGVLSIDLNMNNRVTRFVLAEIVEEDGQLVSTEWL